MFLGCAKGLIKKKEKEKSIKKDFGLNLSSVKYNILSFLSLYILH